VPVITVLSYMHAIDGYKFLLLHTSSLAKGTSRSL